MAWKASLGFAQEIERLLTSYTQALKFGSLALLLALVAFLPCIFMTLGAIAAAAAGAILLQGCRAGGRPNAATCLALEGLQYMNSIGD